MAPIYKISIIQLYSKPLDPENNFNRAAALIRQAASQGSHLAVLPEFHLTSWAPKSPSFRTIAGEWETWLDKYRALAKELGICIVPGTITQRVFMEMGKERLFNVCFFIDNEGEICGNYAKKNLWHSERAHLEADVENPHMIIDTPLGPVGLLICWDLAFPEAWRSMIAAGAKIIIVPSYWTSDSAPHGFARTTASEANFLNSITVSRAFENTCAVVFVNAGGPSASHSPDLINEYTEKHYCGLSQVAVPFYGTIGRIDGPEERLKTVEVDMAVLEEAEADYKVRKDLNEEKWHYIVQDGGNEKKFSEDEIREVIQQTVETHKEGLTKDYTAEDVEGAVQYVLALRKDTEAGN